KIARLHTLIESVESDKAHGKVFAETLERLKSLKNIEEGVKDVKNTELVAYFSGALEAEEAKVNAVRSGNLDKVSAALGQMQNPENFFGNDLIGQIALFLMNIFPPLRTLYENTFVAPIKELQHDLVDLSNASAIADKGKVDYNLTKEDLDAA